MKKQIDLAKKAKDILTKLESFEDNMDELMTTKLFKELNDYFCHPEDDE